MSAVDQHRQLDRGRAPGGDHRLHRRPRGTSVEEHVVDQEHRALVDQVACDRGKRRRGTRLVIAIGAHIQPLDRRTPAPDLSQHGRQPLRQGQPAGHDAEGAQPLDVGLVLQHLVRDPSPRSPHSFRVQDGCLVAGHLHHSRPPQSQRRTAIRTTSPWRAWRK